MASDHTVVIFFDAPSSSSRDRGDPIGYIKYGTKDLYFYQKNGKVVQKTGAHCLLDFFVSEQCQRGGIGLQLFNEMLKVSGLLVKFLVDCVLLHRVVSSEPDTDTIKRDFNVVLYVQNLGLSPSQLAYDRPSPKLLSFLKKHFGLVNPDQQPNRYTIYDGYFVI